MVGTTELIMAVLALQGINLGISVVNARKVGHDSTARQKAADAHKRINEYHLKDP